MTGPDDLPGRLLAVSDPHIVHEENRALPRERIVPRSPGDWLIVAGDVSETVAGIEWALDLLDRRFARVVWASGNHELWTRKSDPVQLRGEERYRHLVEICRRLGVLTPEFATGRHCARLALADLDVPPGPIGAGPRGEPRWPGGIVGSLTHCASFRAAAVARRTDLLGLGIDAEPHAPLPDGILDAIALPEERSHLDQLADSDQEFTWDRLLFSAKESIFKVCFPLARRHLGFDEARIELGRDGCFTVRLLVPGPRVHGRSLTGFTGRWMVGRGAGTDSGDRSGRRVRRPRYGGTTEREMDAAWPTSTP
ncbi:4'-phosphopantetheinyl transferase superfamily protein [Streptomyces sp. NPDC094034]|uniref:4'-phosphopantetheinyl transferase superfamily protein n=1 Tax=Streptomyces sp. NPDC094034 TaxID=3155309 RepID=UPI00332D6BBD